MKLNEIYESIVELGGDCFTAYKRPPCQSCPFSDKCYKVMIKKGENVPKEKRLGWALDELAQEYLLNDYGDE